MKNEKEITSNTWKSSMNQPK